MPVLICGSFAYDTIMVFDDRFKNHILPDKVHVLNVSFSVPTLRREFGGCAGNIAYNLKLLGGDPLPMATVGHDFDPYLTWLEEQGITADRLRVVDDAYTAQAFITTDMDDNQITAFHVGAMGEAHLNSVLETASAVPGVNLGIVAPDGPDGMMRHAREFREAGIPFIFDPGQAMPLFDGEKLLEFARLATWIAVNDYEAELFMDRTGKTLEELAEEVDALIVTRGAQGSEIHADGQKIDVPAVKAEKVADPTGCGDAYRAGLLYGLSQGFSWEITGRIASLMGAIKVAHPGTQNHRFTRAEFAERYMGAFGKELPEPATA